VGYTTYAAEAVPADNTLETFSLGNADYVNKFTFFKNIHHNRVAKLFAMTSLKTGKLYKLALGRYTGFGKMAHLGLVGMLFLFIVESKLDGIISVHFLGPDLGDIAGPGFNNRAGHIPAIGIEYAGHPDFFSYNS
jgi:hypothetical protein